MRRTIQEYVETHPILRVEQKQGRINQPWKTWIERLAGRLPIIDITAVTVTQRGRDGIDIVTRVFFRITVQLSTKSLLAYSRVVPEVHPDYQLEGRCGSKTRVAFPYNERQRTLEKYRLKQVR
jgi:hypothetical protein